MTKELEEYLYEYGRRARKAHNDMMEYSSQKRQNVLHHIASTILDHQEDILAANKIDIKNAKERNLEPSLIDRLELTANRIKKMAKGIDQIAVLPDPIGSISNLNTQRRGFKVGKMRVPIGVIGIIYEARPNVTLDAAAICLKSGNACILRGGKESFHTNSKIVQLIQQSLSDVDFNKDSVQLIDTTDRVAVEIMLKAKDIIDLIIPRGGKGLVKLISENAKVPVIKHLDGICHIYIDEHADNEKAISVSYNAKTYRYGICGALETLLIHKSKISAILPKLIQKLQSAGVEVIADKYTQKKFPDIELATDEDWSTEYLAPKLSIKSIDDLEQAIEHINYFGSHHTDSIISEHSGHQNRFLNLVDSSSVMINLPTCFADGFEYGLGAEIGISTDKLHARGPVGILELTSEKFIVLGDGEIRT